MKATANAISNTVLDQVGREISIDEIPSIDKSVVNTGKLLEDAITNLLRGNEVEAYEQIRQHAINQSKIIYDSMMAQIDDDEV